LNLERTFSGFGERWLGRPRMESLPIPLEAARPVVVIGHDEDEQGRLQGFGTVSDPTAAGIAVIVFEAGTEASSFIEQLRVVYYSSSVVDLGGNVHISRQTREGIIDPFLPVPNDSRASLNRFTYTGAAPTVATPLKFGHLVWNFANTLANDAVNGYWTMPMLAFERPGLRIDPGEGLYIYLNAQQRAFRVSLFYREYA